MVPTRRRQLLSHGERGLIHCCFSHRVWLPQFNAIAKRIADIATVVTARVWNGFFNRYLDLRKFAKPGTQVINDQCRMPSFLRNERRGIYKAKMYFLVSTLESNTRAVRILGMLAPGVY